MSGKEGNVNRQEVGGEQTKTGMQASFQGTANDQTLTFYLSVFLLLLSFGFVKRRRRSLGPALLPKVRLGRRGESAPRVS